MDISKFLPGLRKSDDVATDEPKKDQGPKNGPVRYRNFTAGQQRRLQERIRETARRKANRRFRRDWMRNERRVSVLRGQLIVAGLLPSVSGVEFPPAVVKNVVEHLTAAYGSPEAALEHHNGLMGERQ